METKEIQIDTGLTTRIKNGDVKAFELVFHQFKSQLYHFTFSYLKSESESEEIVQQAFLTLWEKRFSLIETYTVKNYLYRIVTNAVYNHLKHLAIQKKYNDFVVHNTKEEDDDTQQKLAVKDLENEIDRLVNQLPEQTQKIFLLSRMEGKSYQEIAFQLGISVRTVENLIYRALKFIKENLKDDHLVVLFVVIYFWK